ncbi:hypothetical protein [Leclercia sp. UBA5958]|uniref:hypothetical protein n=1 Tax=Leclercia sp. UBA5958 TaxID=1946742 RepID=UPI00257A7404|nr:hypothetical protein [Leclercia sp. UBA5958]
MCENVTGNSQKANSLKAEQEALPDLTRLFKKNRRDESVLKTAKTLLVRGMPHGKVALLLRLDPEFVAELAKTWNPRFRRVAYTSQWTTKLTVREYFDSGAMLEKICVDLHLPLFSVVQFLKQDGITPQQMQARWPEHDNQLVIEFRKTVQRHAQRKQKPPRLH